MNNRNYPILLIDGVCNLCNRTVQFILRRDLKKKIKFAALQSDSGQSLLKKFNLPLRDFDTFIFIQNGKAFTKSTAVLHVLKEIGGIWKFFYVFIIIPKPIRNFFYGIVSATRFTFFGKRKTCMVPDKNISERFL